MCVNFLFSFCRIPRTIGVSIPMKATFFITYIMVDGWAGIASEILRLKPLVIFHLKNLFLVKTERDREKAMDRSKTQSKEEEETEVTYASVDAIQHCWKQPEFSK